MPFIRRAGFCALLIASATTVAIGQQPRPPQVVTAADYARAERFMTYNTTPLVLHAAGRPTWIDQRPASPSAADERFWYRTTTEAGAEAILIDPATATRSACDL